MYKKKWIIDMQQYGQLLYLWEKLDKTEKILYESIHIKFENVQSNV